MPVRGEPFDWLGTSSVELHRPFDKLRANGLSNNYSRFYWESD